MINLSHPPSVVITSADGTQGGIFCQKAQDEIDLNVHTLVCQWPLKFIVRFVGHWASTCGQVGAPCTANTSIA